MFSQLDRLCWISHRFSRLHTNVCGHVQVCVCAWLWGVADPCCYRMSCLILSHGHRSSIIHEINAETQPGLIQENLSPPPGGFSSITPSFCLDISLKIIFSSHFSFLRLSCESCEHEKWECSPQGTTASERQWEGDTNDDQGSVNVCYMSHSSWTMSLGHSVSIPCMINML